MLAEVVPDFRTTGELRDIFFAADCLAPGERLVFNTFLARGDFPDDAARELGQQLQRHDLTRDELATAASQLPVDLVSDDSAYDYEKAHLPDGAWPPTGWYDGWASGLDVFDLERETSDRIALARLSEGVVSDSHGRCDPLRRSKRAEVRLPRGRLWASPC